MKNIYCTFKYYLFLHLQILGVSGTRMGMGKDGNTTMPDFRDLSYVKVKGN